MCLINISLNKTHIWSISQSLTAICDYINDLPSTSSGLLASKHFMISMACLQATGQETKYYSSMILCFAFQGLQTAVPLLLTPSCMSASSEEAAGKLRAIVQEKISLH